MVKRLLVAVLISISSIFTFASPARVLIIRHAEKPADSNDPNLTAKGYERAKALTNLFQIHPEYASKGLPTAMFAARYIPGKNSNRAIETATPLADSLHLQLQTPFVGADAAKLADDILKNTDLNDKVILIAWVHGNIPNLATALGGNCPDQWDGSDVYDRVWQLDYSTRGVSCTDVPESVLPGDSN